MLTDIIKQLTKDGEYKNMNPIGREVDDIDGHAITKHLYTATIENSIYGNEDVEVSIETDGDRWELWEKSWDGDWRYVKAY